jgi:hypothetical protein
MESRRGGRLLVLIELVECGVNGLSAAGASYMMLDNSEDGRPGCARR